MKLHYPWRRTATSPFDSNPGPLKHEPADTNLSPWPTSAVGTLVLVSLVLSTLQMALPVFSLQVFSRVLPTGNLSTLVALYVLVVFLVLCQFTLECGRSMIFARLAVRAGHWCYGRLLSADVSLMERQARMRDIDTVTNFLTCRLAKALVDVPWSFCFIIAIYGINSILGFLTTAAACLVLAIATVGNLLLRGTHRAASDSARRWTSALTSDDTSSSAAKVMGITARAITWAKRQREQLLPILLAAASRQGCFDALRDHLRLLIQASILAATAGLVIARSVEPGAIVASGMLFARALAPHEQLAAATSTLSAVWRATKRIRHTLRQQAQMPESDLQALPQVQGRLSLERVSFRDPLTGQLLLSDVDLTVQVGEVIIIAGAEGAGKTLLAKIMAGAVLPTQGRVCLDGFALHTVEPQSLSRNLGFLPAEDYLGSDCFSEIISRSETASIDEITWAAHLAGAHDLILRQPHGYKTPAPGRLSNGQKRKVALARAFFREPKVIILDEPTASLDEAGEQVIADSVRALSARGSAVVVITRSPPIWALGDRFVMLEGGRVARVLSRQQLQLAHESHRSVSAEIG